MPILLDLCCGLGGWSRGFVDEGWQCIGVDVMDFSASYPGRFIQADLLAWAGWRHIRADLITASPPCDEFSRFSMPWTRARNPPAPSMALWNKCLLIARESRTPIILENVRGAQQFVGRSQFNCGPFHLWGDVPPLVPVFAGKKKESFGGKQKAERAVIPYELSRHFARIFKR